MSESEFTYFQYQKEHGLPVYVRAALEEFEPTLVSFLAEMKFIELTSEEKLSLESKLKSRFEGNLLTIKLASALVSRQINQVVESDHFGPECITPKDGYKVYRYKKKSLLVYSFGANSWEMGCHEDFGDETDKPAYRTIINRYLSWALMNSGIVGFWGVPIDEGIVVLKRSEAQGEAVFVDVRKRKIFTVDGSSSMKGSFKILRLDSIIKNENIRMTGEQLVSFLTVNSTFFDYKGLSIPVRQAIKALSSMAEGLIHPRDNFKPRTDLSL